MNISLYIPLIALTTTLNLAQAGSPSEEDCHQAISRATAYQVVGGKLLDKCIAGDTSSCRVFVALGEATNYQTNLTLAGECLETGVVDSDLIIPQFFASQLEEFLEKLTKANEIYH
jgi:hypothetical protein